MTAPETNDQVVLRLDVGHAEALTNLLDLATRIHMGQLEEIANLLRLQAIKVRDDLAPDGARVATMNEVDGMEGILGEAKRLIGHASGHFGMGAKGLGHDARAGYEVKKALDQALHNHLRPHVRHDVRADGIGPRYASGQAPTAEVVVATT